MMGSDEERVFPFSLEPVSHKGLLHTGLRTIRFIFTARPKENSMPMNLTTDTASDVVQADAKKATKNNKTSRKIISRAKKSTRKSNKRTGRVPPTNIPAYSDPATRLMGDAKSALNDAYDWAGDSSKRMTRAARKAGIPPEYANDRALIVAAVGLGASVAVGALIMGYSGFGVKRPIAKRPSSRRRSNRKA